MDKQRAREIDKEGEREEEREMKGYSIHRLECNPSLNGFSQITACSPIKSVSHSTLPLVSVCIGQHVCICVFDLSMTVNLCVLSPSDKSLQRPREQLDWLRGEDAHISLCTHTHKCSQEEVGVS